MKHKAQYVVAILFLISFIKSFKFQASIYDVIFILICAIIYLVYEFIADHKVKQDLIKLSEDTSNKFKTIEKEMQDTKSYVSTVSLSTIKR